MRLYSSVLDLAAMMWLKARAEETYQYGTSLWKSSVKTCSLRNSLSDAVRDQIVINVEKAKTTYNLIENTVELIQRSSQFCIPWIVFDRDEVKEFDEILRKTLTS